MYINLYNITSFTSIFLRLFSRVTKLFIIYISGLRYRLHNPSRLINGKPREKSKLIKPKKYRLVKVNKKWV